jgi:hypothetical protein
MLESGNPPSKASCCDSNYVRRLKDSSINIIMYVGQLLMQTAGIFDHFEELICCFVADLFSPEINKATSIE